MITAVIFIFYPDFTKRKSGTLCKGRNPKGGTGLVLDKINLRHAHDNFMKWYVLQIDDRNLQRKLNQSFNNGSHKQTGESGSMQVREGLRSNSRGLSQECDSRLKQILYHCHDSEATEMVMLVWSSRNYQLHNPSCSSVCASVFLPIICT